MPMGRKGILLLHCGHWDAEPSRNQHGHGRHAPHPPRPSKRRASPQRGAHHATATTRAFYMVDTPRACPCLSLSRGTWSLPSLPSSYLLNLPAQQRPGRARLTACLMGGTDADILAAGASTPGKDSSCSVFQTITFYNTNALLASHAGLDMVDKGHSRRDGRRTCACNKRTAIPAHSAAFTFYACCAAPLPLQGLGASTRTPQLFHCLTRWRACGYRCGGRYLDT